MLQDIITCVAQPMQNAAGDGYDIASLHRAFLVAYGHDPVASYNVKRFLNGIMEMGGYETAAVINSIVSAVKRAAVKFGALDVVARYPSGFIFMFGLMQF
nr:MULTISPECIES: hypothetical protein [Anaerotruncus]